MKQGGRAPVACLFPALRLSAALTLAVSAAARAQSAQAGASPPVSLTLSEAVEQAIANSPVVTRGAGNLRVAHAAQRTAAAAYLPTLSLESDAIRASTPSPVAQPGTIGGIADHTTAMGLASSVDIFTAGRRRAERRRSDAVAQSADADLVARRYTVELDAKRAFFDALRADELARVAQARVARAQEGLAAAKLRHDVGTATGSDELRARLEMTTAQQTQLQAEAARRTAAFALGRIVGRIGAVQPRLTDSLAATPLPMSDDSVLASIDRESPQVRTTKAVSVAAGAALSVAHARYAPTLNLSGGYRWLNQPAPALFGNMPLWDLKVGVAYPIFDGLQREEAVTRADAERESTVRELADARREVHAEGERVLAELHVAEQRIALAEEAVRVAREDLRVITARYRAGAATILDRITSQVNLATAESDLVNVRYDYQVQRAALAALAGREL